VQLPTLNHHPQPTPAPPPGSLRSDFGLPTSHFPVPPTQDAPRSHLPLFDPSPDLTSVVLNDFDNSRLSLQDIAEIHKTTVDALALWLARPHIAEVCAARRSMISDRARTSAATFLPNVARVLNGILDDHEYDATHAANTTSPRALELRQRSRETVRKASALLRSITRFDLDAPIRHSEPSSAPGTRSERETTQPPDPSPKSEIRNPQSEVPPPTLIDYITQVENSPDHAGCHVHVPVVMVSPKPSTAPDSGLPSPDSVLSTQDSGLPAQDSRLPVSRSDFPLPIPDFPRLPKSEIRNPKSEIALFPRAP